MAIPERKRVILDKEYLALWKLMLHFEFLLIKMFCDNIKTFSDRIIKRFLIFFFVPDFGFIKQSICSPMTKIVINFDL